MLNNIKSEIHAEVISNALEQQAVTNLDSINQVAANAPETAQDKRIQRRLRRVRRDKRNHPAGLGLWRVSMW